MIEIDIPGAGKLVLEHLVCDYNGTLACDGKLSEGVGERLLEVASRIETHVLTADTYGHAREHLIGLPVHVHVLGPDDSKGSYLSDLGCPWDHVATIGNGFNDATILDRHRVGLSIAVLGPEGLSVHAMKDAHVLVRDIRDGLDLLLKPSRIVATLRA
ncbi:MAG TPA: ATPase P [Myxococcales bacterium]